MWIKLSNNMLHQIPPHLALARPRERRDEIKLKLNK